MIRWTAPDGTVAAGSLPSLLAALSRGEAVSFPALRPHQREPWHAFLCQVAALALIHSCSADLPVSKDAWETLLLGLTPEWPDGEAWMLVVDDWSRPALLQPPLADPQHRSAYKTRVPTPDALDVLVTAKNHDVKQRRMTGAQEEDWLFALVTLQTSGGFLGAGHYGVSRMNGGFGCRMTLGIRPAGGASVAFSCDVLRLLECADARPILPGGRSLLWLEPWDGRAQLAFLELDNLYVEVCRRVRLVRRTSGLEAQTATSKAPRVAAAERRGVTGDPWAPVKADGSTSVTPSRVGLGYRQIGRLLDPAETTRPVLAELVASDAREGTSLVASALVRGQGRTEGLHRRTLQLSRAAAQGIESTDVLDRMGQTTSTRTRDAGLAVHALRRALLHLVQGGPEVPRLDDDASIRKVMPWLERFERTVDDEFFDDPFWAEFNDPAGPRRAEWRERLRQIATEIFDEAAEGAPRTVMRRVRARARAANVLQTQLRRFVGHADVE